MQERWLRLEEFPNYAVSDQGRVCNIKYDRLLRTSLNQRGILQVGITPPGRRQTMKSVSLLVADAFMPDHDENFNCPINLDGRRDNCALTNLTWRPRWFAQKYHAQFQYPIFHEMEVELEVKETGERFDNLKDPCVQKGLRFQDIRLSYMTDRPTFPTWEHWRRL